MRQFIFRSLAAVLAGLGGWVLSVLKFDPNDPYRAVGMTLFVLLFGVYAAFGERAVNPLMALLSKHN